MADIRVIAWMIFWNQSAFKTSNVFVTINSLAQLYYVFAKLPPMDLSSRTSMLTHVVAKTFAGIGVLDLLHNGSVAYFNHDLAPSPLVQAFTGVGFAAMAACSDWIFGGCLVYDLIALAVGQRKYGNEGWSNMLGIYAGATAAIVAAKNVMR
jgi:hypothetical protein